MRSVPLCLVLIAACGGDEPSTKVPETREAQPSAVAVTTPSASPAPASSASADVVSKATPVESAAPVASAAAGAKGPCRFDAYAGPKGKAQPLTAKKAWALVPVSTDCEYDLVKLATEDYVRTEGDVYVVTKYDGSELHVPALLVRPLVPQKGLKKGDAVMADVAAASGTARVLELTHDDPPRVKIAYEWAGSVSEDELDLDQVVKLEDKLTFGQPIAVEGGHWPNGLLVYSDASETWYITASGHFDKAATKDVSPIKVTKPFAKGAKVAYAGVSFEPGKVVEVLGSGAAYKLKLDSGKEEIASMDEVTSPR